MTSKERIGHQNQALMHGTERQDMPLSMDGDRGRPNGEADPGEGRYQDSSTVGRKIDRRKNDEGKT